MNYRPTLNNSTLKLKFSPTNVHIKFIFAILQHVELFCDPKFLELKNCNFENAKCLAGILIFGVA